MKYRRKRFIIEGNFQTRFILRFMLVIVGATLLSTGAIIGLFFLKYYLSGVDLSSAIIVMGDEGSTNVTGIFQVILTPLIGANLVVLCIIVPFSLLYSHRVAGPIYRLEQSLELILNGEMDFVITLRKKDEFTSLAERMNELIDYLRRNVGEARSSYRLVKEKAKKMEDLLQARPLDVETLSREVTDLKRFFSERGIPFTY